MIRQCANAASYARGQDYYRSGSVSGLVQRGETLEAEVEGSSYTPYAVRIMAPSGTAIEATCTCPYDYAGWCKHIVAVLLAYIHNRGSVETRPGLEDQLAGLDRDQLHRLLLGLVARHPGLADDIETQLPLIQRTGQPRTAAKPPPIEVNVGSVRRQVRSALRSLDRMSGSEAYWQIGQVVHDIEEIARQAQPYIEAGDGRNAIALLEAVTEEYLKEWTMLDDSDGEASALFTDLGTWWTEAILSPDLSEAERKPWAKTLKKWQREIEDYGDDGSFEAAIHAAEQGWEYAPLKRVLAGEVTSKGAWSEEVPFYMDELAKARLRVLERQGRHQEYLYLAEAEGQSALYVNMLARMGRIREAMEKGLAYLDTPDDVLTVAKTLHEAGHTDEALRLAEHGLKKKTRRSSDEEDFFDYDDRKYDLARWASQVAEEHGNGDLALRAAETAFDEQPDLALYQRLQTLAADGWSALREMLLKRLRKSKRYDEEGVVDIFLHEGLIDDAIRVVDRDAYHYDLIKRVMDEVVAQRPAWVMEAARRQAEVIMDAGKAAIYHHAIEWLERVRAGYRTMHQEADWRSYRDELLKKHYKKYKLRGMIEAMR
jgi:uncharacterized Zn finger protein